MTISWSFYRKINKQTKGHAITPDISRFAQSCLLGLTPQLKATVWGAPAGPRQTALLDETICMVDGWLTVQKSSAVKKSCCCSEKEQPYFCILFFFRSSVTHAAVHQAQANTVYCSQSDRLTEGLRMAGTSGGGLVQPPAQSKASYSSLLGAVSKHGTPLLLWTACCQFVHCTCKIRVPLFCRNSRSNISVASAATMLPFTSCATADGSRGHWSLQD